MPSRLEVERLPLKGRHLIEASAGTGKTFNITRIYLRMLLEKKLRVQDILVVTFTRAATEELRGRIEQELRKALGQWGNRPGADSFYDRLEARLTHKDASILLNDALLNLDEAAIYTIHGFCRRVLTQQAFISGLPLEMVMEADITDLRVEAVRDWYRQLKGRADDYLAVYEMAKTPEDFLRVYGSLTGPCPAVNCVTPEQVQQHFFVEKKRCYDAVKPAEHEIREHLIDAQKGERKKEREAEFESLLAWLQQADLSPLPDGAGRFIHGNRYARKPGDLKSRLKQLFEPVKALKKQAGEAGREMQKAAAHQIAVEGARVIRGRIAEAKQQRSLMDFDGLVEQLYATLFGDNGPGLAATLAAQYPVALVDEFQDTDPRQYAIFDSIYNDREVTAFYMIGDPKQAVYAFRGGDVFAYLKARDDADQQWYMDTNWRSSLAMVTAYNRLFYGEPLPGGAAAPGAGVFKLGIGYTPVRAAGQADTTPFSGDAGKALSLVHFPHNEYYGTAANNQDFREVIACWCAGEIQRLFSDRVCLGSESLKPRDIAVLVRDKVEAMEVQAALKRRGYASVYLSTRENVFHSEDAEELQRALAGILAAEDDRKLAAALATRLFGADSAALYRALNDDVQWEQYRLQFIALRQCWLRRGFMVMALRLLYDCYQPDGGDHERALTNSLHLIELLQQASLRFRQPSELVSWLAEQRQAGIGGGSAELRLESDADLIRVVTQHGSKGLEYPVVFIPFATRSRSGAGLGPLWHYHDRTTRQARMQVGRDDDIAALAEEERLAEDVRLLYVAVTRAEQRCYLCVTPFKGYEKSPLGLVLGLEERSALLPALQRLRDDEPDAIGVMEVEGSDVALAAARAGETTGDNPSARAFTGSIERDWGLSSFTALTRGARYGGVTALDRDENATAAGPQPDPEALALRFTLKKGVDAGNLLHDALEQVDFSQPDWPVALQKPLTRYGALAAGHEPELQAWLDECLQTPLPLGPALGELSRRDTLKEAGFYFPMEQGSVAGLARVLGEHRGQAGMPGLPEGRILKGMMHGFIDLVFQWQGRYYLADYKSTHLGNSFSDYSEEAVRAHIRGHDYDLQYLIYSLALHRYLKTRLLGYDPRQHLGGVYYLYLRGMAPGRDTGVFYTRLLPEVIGRLDRAFPGKVTETVNPGGEGDV